MPEDLQNEIKVLAEKIPGCRYVSLVGYDGMTVAQHIIEADFDVSTHDAEISSIVMTCKDVKNNLGLGVEKELIWITEKAIYVISQAGDEYFIYICLKSAGSNPGLARIELNKTKEAIRKIIYAGK